MVVEACYSEMRWAKCVFGLSLGLETEERETWVFYRASLHSWAAMKKSRRTRKAKWACPFLSKRASEDDSLTIHCTLPSSMRSGACQGFNMLAVGRSGQCRTMTASHDANEIHLNLRKDQHILCGICRCAILR
jgi:hypothetical protein